MGIPRIYLDYNATAPARPEALAIALAAMDAGGNPSSVHGEGRAARGFVEAARRQVASLLGCRSDLVCFTSGGTEAANLALHEITLADGTRAARLLVNATDHVAVTRGHGFGPAAQTLPVTPAGVLDLEHLRLAVRGRAPAVLAVQAANNETGVVQPVREAAGLVQAEGGIVVCDAVQAAGRIACDPKALGADVVFISGHKLGGIAGAGALAVLNESVRLAPLVRGGGQERGMRGGTETVPAIAAFGAAAQAGRGAPDAATLRALRDGFEARLRALAPDAVLFGAAVERLPNTSAFAIPGIGAEPLMMALDLSGVAVSSGSACSSGKVGRSHVLEAMGVRSDLRPGVIRVSLGWRSAASDVDAMMAALDAALRRLRRPVRSAA